MSAVMKITTTPENNDLVYRLSQRRTSKAARANLNGACGAAVRMKGDNTKGKLNKTERAP